MSNDLILSFPVLKQNSDDFIESVSYKVEAAQDNNDRKLYITHTLTGKSFVADLIKNKKAKFSVSLFYKDSAERQKFICDKIYFDDEKKEITGKQTIDITFSYAPETTANIVLLENQTITASGQAGLTEFWQGETFDIPAFSRIAYHLKLNFTSGAVSSLIWKDMAESYNNGSIKTIVTETAGENEQPIKIICAKDVYDELDRGLPENPTAIKLAIITQILCHVYAYMNSLEDKKNDIHDGLLKHMEMVKDKSNQDWESDDFNASFAATKMLPYAIEAPSSEDG